MAKKHERSDSADDSLRHPTIKRAKEIDSDTPFEQLCELVDDTHAGADDVKPRNVLHWFRSKDLRQEDNKALWAASQKAKEGGVSLVTMYLYSPQDLEWHGTSPARSDFILENLRIVKGQLEEKNIPLAIVTAEERSDKLDVLKKFIKDNDISQIYANMEYEVDELRRDIRLAKYVLEEEDLSLHILHDQTVLVPGTVVTGNGGPMKVFTPYHKAWLAETKQDPSVFEDLMPPPESNGKDAKQKFKQLFETKIPDLPENKQFESKEERERLRKLWPSGHDAGMQRLKHFLDKKVKVYARDRSKPAADMSSRLSPYFAAGVISVREVLAETKKWNKGAHFDDGDKGVDSWVREIVFREFYRQVTAMTPHTSMNLPQNMKFDNVEWEDDEEGWEKWYEGKTGYPFVDAGMRQLNHEGYMHNRLRMNTASFLRANLLIDYRRGERYFAEHLIDWDLNNNTQGWEPSYTVFNPVVQAEKCDPDGDYIRKWVPELKDVEGKAVFEPHARLSEAEFAKTGYPKPHVDFKESAQRAKERYKRDLAEADV